MRSDDREEQRRRCGLCGKTLRPYDSISAADVGERCYRCFNEELAERLGVDFDNTPIAPMVVTDVDGGSITPHSTAVRSITLSTVADDARARGARLRSTTRPPRIERYLRFLDQLNRFQLAGRSAIRKCGSRRRRTVTRPSRA